MLEAQNVRQRERWDHREAQPSAGVGDDEKRLPANAIDPDADGEAEEENGCGLDRAQQTHLARARVKREHGGQRESDERHLVTEDRDTLGEPKPKEVATQPSAHALQTTDRHHCLLEVRRSTRMYVAAYHLPHCTSESSGGPRNTISRAGSTQKVSGNNINTGSRRAAASA